ncbi:MAG: 4Fe-4S dicluster domain-containing protein [Desulfatibacillaceae bacterium]
MRILKIDKNDWTAGVDRLAGSYRVVGPRKEGAFHNFEVLEKGEQPDFDFQNTRLSAKGVVYPQSEKMMRYTLDESREDHHVMHDLDKDIPETAILGVRPCDAKAIELVNLNFDTDEYKDPYWIRRYEKLYRVGLACDNPCGACFCTSAGSGPYDEQGLDILLVDNGDSYLARVLTDKGEKLAQAAGWSTEAGDVEAVIADRAKAAEDKITSRVDQGRLTELATNDLHGAPFWDDVSFSCINCGTCTYLCPTCWCFDIQDEVCGTEGCRLKNWDSCMYPLFTMHGTGHNPRGTKLDRVRQRFMHKLKYFTDKYDQGIMCVGCGRCVAQCPVNIDIRRVCDLMNSYEPGSECAV